MSFFWLIQIVSVAGVAAVIALTWAVGWGKRAAIASVDDAAARLKRDFPSADVKGGVVASDGRTALLDLRDGIGLVTVLGDEFVTRKLRVGDIAAKSDGAGLALTIEDPTLVRARLVLDEEAARHWQTHLQQQWG